MDGTVSLLRPEAPTPTTGRLSLGLPADLLLQIRRRIRILAILLFVGFAIDPFFYGLAVLIARSSHQDLTGSQLAILNFLWINLAALIASAGLWAASRSQRVSASLLHTLGLVYEVLVCAAVAVTTYWPAWIDTGHLPGLTWIGAIVIFVPLIMPGPPRRMLAAAIAAGAMAPLSLLVLDLTHQIDVPGPSYFDTTVNTSFAVLFAFISARVVYGMGRQLAAARELGSYRLEERIGQGGMGEVWRARHRMLARPAAIKLIRPAVDAGAGVSEEAVQRFEREAQAIASLRSPHTVEIFDFGVAEDGSFYYAMELLDGLDADSLVKRYGPIPAERAIGILVQICHSLAEAESRGLVHRDIKPANVFLCRYGLDLDFVKVLDFGLVKTLDGGPRASPMHSKEDAVRGTPAFIAPEQALGRQIDGRADIYATGCVAYWLLSGELVFHAPSPIALLMHHAGTPPTPLSRRTELAIPPALDALVMSCLSKDPADRPQTAAELGRALAAIVGATAWTPERAERWWSTHLPAPAA
jgi:eukaryotic-like serine/threonine-protein kinase